jgi:hypothetical protein
MCPQNKERKRKMNPKKRRPLDGARSHGGAAQPYRAEQSVDVVAEGLLMQAYALPPSGSGRKRPKVPSKAPKLTTVAESAYPGRKSKAEEGKMVIQDRRGKPSGVEVDDVLLSDVLSLFRSEVGSTGQTVPLAKGFAAVTLKLVGGRMCVAVQIAKSCEKTALRLTVDGSVVDLQPMDSKNSRVPGVPSALGDWYSFTQPREGAVCKLEISVHQHSKKPT